MSNSVIYDPSSALICVTLVGAIHKQMMDDLTMQTLRLVQQHSCFPRTRTTGKFLHRLVRKVCLERHRDSYGVQIDIGFARASLAGVEHTLILQA